MKRIVLIIFAICGPMIPSNQGFAAGLLLRLGAEESVQAGDPLADIKVYGYSVPSYVDWNNDGKKDLVVGEGGGGYPDAKVRVYLNDGTTSDPQFSDYFYAQSNGNDLTCPASGCLGCFPRVVYWDPDARKDLLVGQADGAVKIFLNTGTDTDPTFDAGQNLHVGYGSGVDLNVGRRATPTLVDWDNDGKKDLVAGALDGKIHIYLNCGCTGQTPAFYHSSSEGTFAQENDANLVVPQLRSSPVILDLDGDDKKDVLTGDTLGQILFYPNVGTDKEPTFSGYSLVNADNVPIDLPESARSRPFVCDWTGDGYLDLLIGTSDGKVHLYQSVPQHADMDHDYDVDFADFAAFAAHWLDTDCGSCDAADLTGDGNVWPDDLRDFSANWLAGVE